MGHATWTSVTDTLTEVGSLAMFAPVAPYLALAGLATQMVKTLVQAFDQPALLSSVRNDFYLDEPFQSVLQSGRYVAWRGAPTKKEMAARYMLTGDNVLVRGDSGVEFRSKPYFVFQVDSKPRPEYDSFEIGADSAAILSKWGNKRQGETIFTAAKELATQVNDARQLAEISALKRQLARAKKESRKAELRAMLGARAKLLSNGSSKLLRDLLEL